MAPLHPIYSETATEQLAQNPAALRVTWAFVGTKLQKWNVRMKAQNQ